MTMPNRQIDTAMAEDRLEKRTIRSLWLEKVKIVAQAHPDSQQPWYLTLSGAEGRDIQLFIESGLVTLTEINSIADRDKHRFVAVEKDSSAVLALQRKFIGLRIKEVDFGELIRGEEPFTWPNQEDEIFCRAHVVNLDFNGSLNANHNAGQIIFPILSWIQKLCLLHGKNPRTDWTLCLTLNGQLQWSKDVFRWINNFLRENLSREPQFAEHCLDFFGSRVYGLISQQGGADLTNLRAPDRQRIVMVVVPKVIANQVHTQGWRVDTERCLRYGGTPGHAPMVTWIMNFTWDGAAAATPDALYRAALRQILTGAGVVNADGTIT